jgi:hypothetical protein
VPQDHPQIPIDLLRPHVEDWIARNESHAAAFAKRCGLHGTLIQKILNGSGITTKMKNGVMKRYDKSNVNFSSADAVITKGLENPFLWWTDAKLNEFYMKDYSTADYEYDLHPGKLSCSWCRKWKPLDLFANSVSESNERRQGKRSYCMSCDQKSKRERRARNRDTVQS